MQDNIVDSHRTTDGRTEGRTDGWMDGWMGGWVDGWIDGWMEGGTHGRTSHLYLNVHQPCNDVVPRHAVVLCRAVSQDDQQPLCCEAIVGLLERRRAEQAPVAATETLHRGCVQRPPRTGRGRRCDVDGR